MQAMKSRARFILVMVIWIVMVCPMAMFLFMGFVQDAPLTFQSFNTHLFSAVIGFFLATLLFLLGYLMKITSWKVNIFLLLAYLMNGMLVVSWLGLGQHPLFNLTLIMVFSSTFLFWPFTLQAKRFEEDTGTKM